MSVVGMKSGRARHARSFAGVVAVFGLVLGVLSATPMPADAAATTTSAATSSSAANAGPDVSAGIAKSADLSRFQPGNIISDAVFYDKDTMTEAQIQAFLVSKGSPCSAGYTCLRDYYDMTRTIAADPMCGAYQGGGRERASRIIYKVAQSCGINPQVLIVMLQKEQWLVRAGAPSAYNYRAAMGQGCPDTAACDTRYYGLFNQLRGGAWQLKRYSNPPGTSQYFTWYAPGKTWNVRFHPNASCGSSPVRIQNQATAALYYYTPYQPNAAALRAGYAASSDTCSSYGNRNFYNYFTDWFGSTQGASSSMIRVGGDVFLVSGSNRFPIGPSLLAEYQSVFGAPRTVTAAHASAYALKPKATAFIRDASSGRVAMLRDSHSHYFGSCALVAAWGGQCNTEVSLTSADYQRIPVGERMTWFARTSAGSAVHGVEGRTLVPYADAGSATIVNGGTAPYAPVMEPALLAKYTVGGVQFAPANFVVLSDSSRVWLPTADQRLIYLPAWTVAEELGLPAAAYRRGVDPAVTSAYSQSGRLEIFVQCGQQPYVASRGTLHPATAAAVAGFGVTALDDKTCGRLDTAATAPLDGVFVRAVGGSAVYLAQNGVFRHVASPTVLRQLGGGAVPTILPLSAASVSRLPKGDPYTPAPPPAPSPSMPAGEFFTSDGSSRVYLPTSSNRALYLPAWTIAAELGLPSTASRRISAGEMGAVSVTGTLSQWVVCAGTRYIGAGGVLHPVSAEAAKGFAVAELDQATCDRLQRSTVAPGARVFVRTPGSSAVFVAENGAFRHVTSPSRLLALAGGSAPAVLTVSPNTLDRYPRGAAITATSG